MNKKKDIEISLSPIGKEEIHKLEYALLIGTLFRPEILEMLRNPEERLTWVDSLAVAAAAIAREKAKMTISQIAEELGRTEATIRNHITGKTEAGKLVRETYERFVKEGVKLDIIEKFPSKEIEELNKKVNELSKENEKLKNEIKTLINKIEEIKRNLQEIISLI
ncbi:MAG: transcriptional regulator [Nitrososphaerota archaeon]